MSLNLREQCWQSVEFLPKILILHHVKKFWLKMLVSPLFFSKFNSSLKVSLIKCYCVYLCAALLSDDLLWQTLYRGRGKSLQDCHNPFASFPNKSAQNVIWNPKCCQKLFDFWLVILERNQHVQNRSERMLADKVRDEERPYPEKVPWIVIWQSLLFALHHLHGRTGIPHQSKLGISNMILDFQLSIIILNQESWFSIILLLLNQVA